MAAVNGAEWSINPASPSYHIFYHKEKTIVNTWFTMVSKL